MVFRRIGVAVAVVLAVGAGFANAAPIMPSFAGAPAGGWVTDRYQPTTFADVGTYQGRSDVLGIGITSAGDSVNRTGTGQQGSFYNTQGMQYALSGGAGSVLAADLFIESSWLDPALGSVRSDMWGVMQNSAAPPAVTDYPIIGFTNYGTARYRVYDDDTANGWVDLTNPVTSGWTSFAITFSGSSFDYSINGIAVYSDSTINGTTGFKAVIMQAYNFADPAINNPSANLADYTAHWSNTQAVPEPTTLGLLGLGLVALARRVRNRA